MGDVRVGAVGVLGVVAVPVSCIESKEEQGDAEEEETRYPNSKDRAVVARFDEQLVGR